MKPAPADKPMIVIITGGIGSGKSTVARCFAALGIPVIDTDLIARELVAAGSESLGLISAHFGEQLVNTDGSLNRRLLREQVFEDTQARLWLENLLHPRIREEVLRQVAALQDHDYVLLEIPLFTADSEYHDLAHQILVVDVPESVQLERVAARDNSSTAAVKAIMKTQLSRAERLALADQIIDNSGSAELLNNKVKDLHDYYTRLARHP